MRILLVGEFSGLYRNLKEGLLELGHETKHIADGDGWKEIGGQDMSLNSSSRNYISIVKQLKKMKGFDVVQLVCPTIYRKEFNYCAFKMLTAQNDKMVLSIAGDNYFTYKAYNEGKYRYCVLDGLDEFLDYYNQSTLRGRIRAWDERRIVDEMDGLIPISYEYAEAFRCFSKLKKAIPIPINCDSVKFQDNVIKNNKVCFFHGLNREIPKGSAYIVGAMRRLKEKYPNDVEIIINPRTPLKDYLKIMSQTNVVLDQCKSYMLGLNALYAMAEGKVVLGGNEEENRKELQIENCPAYNILPDEKQILKTMENVLEQKKEIGNLGWKSREYVEEYHSHIKVAEQYINTWKEI